MLIGLGLSDVINEQLQYRRSSSPADGFKVILPTLIYYINTRERFCA